MEFYQSIENKIVALMSEDWPEIREVVSKFCASQPEIWKLPLKGYEAIKARENGLDDLCTAFACSYMAIMLVDDMLDADARGWHNQLGEDQAANMAIVLNSCSDRIIQQMEEPAVVKLRISACLQDMMFETGYGQYLDSKNLPSEESYWRMIRQKSAPFFTGALKAGAILTGITGGMMKDLDLIGQYYGEILQIHDDLNDCFEVPATPDWLMGRSALPILFASTVGHQDKDEFLDILESIVEPASLKRAQQILIESGAVSYCMHEIMQRSGDILARIKEMDGFDQDVLESLFAGFVKPVQEFLNEAGIDQQYYDQVNIPVV